MSTSHEEAERLRRVNFEVTPAQYRKLKRYCVEHSMSTRDVMSAYIDSLDNLQDSLDDPQETPREQPSAGPYRLEKGTAIRDVVLELSDGSSWSLREPAPGS